MLEVAGAITSYSGSNAPKAVGLDTVLMYTGRRIEKAHIFQISIAVSFSRHVSRYTSPRAPSAKIQDFKQI
jgi:hypothetical protein